ncbi:MAG: hypothetical protein MI784_11100 [Cytophagales bacterium]|nr:hypothetical protein [Cytophagales bacterium]
MEVNEIYNTLGQYLLEIIPTHLSSWTKAELILKIQGDYISYSSVCFQQDKKKYLNSAKDTNLEKKIHNLHQFTTRDGKNKWNKAKFILYPDYNFKMEFFWDKELAAH